ncbi:MAG: acetolactate synthase small subunit [Firmicutes bacterium]|nr:acetolactate synthase small subunit [Bacillota bacterium]
MATKEKTAVISILVNNEVNVLTRISGLFGRRGYNITSFTASPTNNPSQSRITIVTTCDERKLDQILTQTAKLESVIHISLMARDDSIYRELLLVKIKAGKKERSDIMEIVNIYRGRIVNLSKKSLIVELTGSSDKLDGFLNMVSCYDLLEVCRTGITGIYKGDEGF